MQATTETDARTRLTAVRRSTVTTAHVSTATVTTYASASPGTLASSVTSRSTNVLAVRANTEELAVTLLADSTVAAHQEPAVNYSYNLRLLKRLTKCSASTEMG